MTDDMRRQLITDLVEAERECMTARDAAALFGVNETAIRVAKSNGRLRPAFALFTRSTPMFTLVSLLEYFAGRAEPKPGMLDRMREHGAFANGYLILTRKPMLRPFEESR